MKYLIILLLPFLVMANDFEDWQINDQHTQVQFSIGYMGVMEVTGLFTQVRGKFEFNPKTSEAKNVLVQIASRSIQTHNKKRDNHLRRADFFYASKFPWIEFTMDKAALKTGKRIINGTLNLRGVSKPIELTANIEGLKPDPWDEGKQSFFMRLTGKIKRSDFGLTWNKALDQGGMLVADEVEFSVDVEANPSDQKLAFSRFYLPNGVIRPSSEISAEDLPQDPVPTEHFEEKEKIELAPKDATNPASVIIGFVLFISITAASLWLKIVMQKKLISHLKYSSISAEILSDLTLLAFVISAFAMTAPLMGYGS